MLGQRRFAFGPLDCLLFQSRFAALEMFARRVRHPRLRILFTDCRLRFPELLQERNVARTNRIATSAEAAVVEAVLAGARQVTGAQVPQQLLRLQSFRAGRCAVAAADARHFDEVGAH